MSLFRALVYTILILFSKRLVDRKSEKYRCSGPGEIHLFFLAFLYRFRDIRTVLKLLDAAVVNDRILLFKTRKRGDDIILTRVVSLKRSSFLHTHTH